MKNKFILKLQFLIIGLIPNLLFSQIWDFPPEAISNWQYNENINKTGLKQIFNWEIEIIDGKETGEKKLNYIQEFDSSGNTISLIFSNRDTILFTNYFHGFWQQKISGNKIYTQSVELDKHGNVTSHRINNNFLCNVSYDSLNRPLVSINNTIKKKWNYLNDKLISFQIYKNNQISEERLYYYDSLQNSISYTTYTTNPEKAELSKVDSVIAFFDSDNRVYRIIDFDLIALDTLTIDMNFEDNTITSRYSEIECSRVKTIKNENDLPIKIIYSNCKDEVYRKIKYEYVYF